MLFNGKTMTVFGDLKSTIYDERLVEATATEFVNKSVKKVGVYGLGYQHSLKKVDLWSVESIASGAFCNDYALDTLIIRTPKVCVLPNVSMMTNNAYVFWRTPIEEGTGFIYVPDDLVDSYKTATNWWFVRDQIKPISELRE